MEHYPISKQSARVWIGLLQDMVWGYEGLDTRFWQEGFSFSFFHCNSYSESYSGGSSGLGGGQPPLPVDMPSVSTRAAWILYKVWLLVDMPVFYWYSCITWHGSIKLALFEAKMKIGNFIVVLALWWELTMIFRCDLFTNVLITNTVYFSFHLYYCCS